MIDKKPIKRSKLRCFMGRKYYTVKKHLRDLRCRGDYGKVENKEEELFMAFQHKTPLLRKLKNVDMHLQYNKITNLRIAIKRLNGFKLKPGECFSYWRGIGKPSRGKGYVPGLVLKPDGSFGEGTGGGLCQLSNMIYWITLHTELEVVERYRHSHDVFPDSNRTQPFGSGATCVYNYLDLRIKNNTNKAFKLVLSMDNEYLIGCWMCDEKPLYSFSIYERDHSFTKGWWGGYIRNNTIYRKRFNRNEEEVADEFITENHAIMMYSPLIEEYSVSKSERGKCNGGD